MQILNKRWVQIMLAAVLGVTVGAVFYPTKRIEERVKEEITEKHESQIKEMKRIYSEKQKEFSEAVDAVQEEHEQYKEETSHRLSSLTTENRELRKSMKRKKFKLVKPDGTIIEKEYEESQSEEVTSIVTEVREEFDRKVSSIENKWKTIHQKRVAKIKEDFTVKIEKLKEEKKERVIVREEEKIVDVNKKNFRPEIGITKDRNMYIHSTYTIWGPVFIGGGVEGNIDNKTLEDVRVGVGIEL